MKGEYSQIPIFPLGGVIFFPKTNLPLNIFEERYLEMVNYALSKDKIIGMIQTMEKSDKLYTVGCFGRITSYNETDDGRYIINLLGVEKFKIIEEIKTLYKFRIFNIKSDQYIEEDLNYTNQEEFDKSILIKKFQNFFRKTEPDLKFKSIDNIGYSDLIKLIAMTCPFKVSEKQMLLESKKMSSLKKNLLSLFDFYINENSKLDSIN